MLIIGHRHIPCETFKRITNIKQIQESSAQKEILWFSDDLKDGLLMAKACAESSITFSVHISNITNCLLFANFLPKYFLITKNAKAYQNLADHYLLDSKILQIINDESEIKKVAKKGIDGVIFKHHLQD